MRVQSVRYMMILLFLVSAGKGFTQEVTARARLDTTAMLIGDQVNIELSVTSPASVSIAWPKIGDTILKTIQVVNRTQIDTAFSQDRKSLTLRQKLLITSFDSGLYTIPPIRFFYRESSDTAIRSVQTGIMLLSVHTVAVDTTRAIKPIKGPLSEPLTFREILPWLLLGILVLGIAAGIFYYLKKRKKNEPVFVIKPKVQVSAHELALGELEKLRMKKLWQSGRVKEYHSELTDILRKYMESRYGIMAMEMTTHEILEALTALGDHETEPNGKLGYILSMADLVKFAKMQPLPVENDTCMDHAVVFVKETAPGKEQTVTNA